MRVEPKVLPDDYLYRLGHKRRVESRAVPRRTDPPARAFLAAISLQVRVHRHPCLSWQSQR